MTLPLIVSVDAGARLQAEVSQATETAIFPQLTAFVFMASPTRTIGIKGTQGPHLIGPSSRS